MYGDWHVRVCRACDVLVALGAVPQTPEDAIAMRNHALRNGGVIRTAAVVAAAVAVAGPGGGGGGVGGSGAALYNRERSVSVASVSLEVRADVEPSRCGTASCIQSALRPSILELWRSALGVLWIHVFAVGIQRTAPNTPKRRPQRTLNDASFCGAVQEIDGFLSAEDTDDTDDNGGGGSGGSKEPGAPPQQRQGQGASGLVWHQDRPPSPAFGRPRRGALRC